MNLFEKWKIRTGLVLLCLWVLTSLTGCAQTPAAVDGQSLKPNQGVLVLRMSSNVDGHLAFLDYKSESTFGSRFAEYMGGPKGAVHAEAGKTKYVLIPLTAGDYMWSRLDVYPKFAWLQASNRFRVVANSITYIGDIKLDSSDRSFSLRVTDGEAGMRDYLDKNYPTYLKTMPVEKSLAEIRL